MMDGFGTKAELIGVDGRPAIGKVPKADTLDVWADADKTAINAADRNFMVIFTFQVFFRCEEI